MPASMTNEPTSQALSETELAILRLLATGATNREIARQRGISEATVKKHVTNINGKLGTGNRTEAVRRALELGLVSVDTPGDPDDGVARDAARHLAAELERTRRRTRRIVRAFVATGVLVLGLVIAGAAAVLVLMGPDDSTENGPIPSPTVFPREWSQGVDLPMERTGLALVADGSDLYAIGGADGGSVLSDTLRYDTRQLAWVAMAAKPTAVRDARAVLAAVRHEDGGSVRRGIVVPGGCGADGRATDVTEVYDPDADRWVAAQPVPEPVCAYALAELRGQVYLFGGRSGEDPSTATNRVWRYDPAVDRWFEEEPMPLGRSDLAAAVKELPSPPQIHVLGGRDRRGRRQPSHWAFMPLVAADRWRTDAGPPLPEGRAGLVAAGLLDGIYVVGGGWDEALADGAIYWRDEPGRGWQPQPARLRGVTPQRGHGLAVVQGRSLHVAGGEFGSRLLSQYQFVRVVHLGFFPGG
jgi:DNA-binding CsgD family transcriptional regulator